jgi:hypothetical protein
MMTEKEANSKWCPMVRVVSGKVDPRTGASEHDGAQSSYNRVVDDSAWAFPKGGSCIGSGCMAWRWSETQQEPFGDGFVGVRGYCGLAGRL